MRKLLLLIPILLGCGPSSSAIFEGELEIRILPREGPAPAPIKRRAVFRSNLADSGIKVTEEGTRESCFFVGFSALRATNGKPWARYVTAPVAGFKCPADIPGRGHVVLEGTGSGTDSGEINIYASDIAVSTSGNLGRDVVGIHFSGTKK